MQQQPAEQQSPRPAEQAAAAAVAASERQQAAAAAAADAAAEIQHATREDMETPGAGLAPGELLHSCRCQWVTPKRVLPGLLRITRTQMHFVADAESAASSGGGEDAAAAAVDAAAAEAGEGPRRRRHQRWQLRGLTEVHHSRFLLQPTALECFMSDRASHALLNFPTHQARLSLMLLLPSDWRPASEPVPAAAGWPATACAPRTPPILPPPSPKRRR